MKKILGSLALVFTALQFATAQEIKFETEEINYGVVEKGADGGREFKFTNVGNAPLKIQSAVGSCGCTVPQYDQQEILPGQTGTIRVQYDTQRVGHFTKYVTVTSNSKTNTTHRLTIQGEVKEQVSTPVKEEGFKN